MYLKTTPLLLARPRANWLILAAIGFVYTALTTVAGAQSAPVILNSSIIDQPGNVIDIQGAGFGASPTIWCSINGAAAGRQPILNYANGVIQFQLPSPLGLYGVSVQNGASTSSVVYVNRAVGMHFDTDQVAPGGAFRIFGRNLYLGSGSPRVDFVSNAGDYTATVNANPKYNTLSVNAPETIPLGTYSIYVSNGFGNWSLAQSLCRETLTVRASGPDTFNLGVSWAADLTFGGNVYNVKTDPRLSLHAVGNGVANDQPAIQAAMNTAGAAGGGVVYLPAGNYVLDQPSSGGPLLYFNQSTDPNVVVQGAGEGVTNLLYGYGSPLPGMYTVCWWAASKSGICDLSILNEDNENSAWANTGTFATGGPDGAAADCGEIFLARCTVQNGNGAQMFLTANHVLVEDCNLTSDNTVLQMGESLNYNVRNNVISQTGGVHVDISSSNDGVVEGNTFQLNANNGAYSPSNIRHGVVIGFAQNDAILNNTFRTFNGTLTYDNDGEAILGEGGANNRLGEEEGTVTASSGNSVTLSRSTPFVPGTSISIVNSVGVGQWRTITARNGNTVTVSSPWLVPPAVGSTYAISVWSSRNTTIDGNTLTGWLRGIWIYQGSTTDTEISNNTLNSMDGIYLMPCQNITRGLGQFDPIWNTVVDGNTLSSSPKTATYINLSGDLQQTNSLVGTMALNDEIANNSITGDGITASGYAPTGPFENDPAWTEGYAGYLRVESSPYNDQAIPALLGTIFQSNTETHCGEQAYLLNGGDYQTVIANSTVTNTPSSLTDSSYYWNTSGSHSSVNTVIVAQAAAPPPAAPTNLSATASSGQVALTWTPSAGASSYNLYYGTSAGGESGTPIATGIATSAYTTTGLTNGATYYFKVVAVNTVGTSPQSNEASATPTAPPPPPANGAPPTPTGVNAVGSNGIATVAWNASAGATSYSIYRSTTPSAEGSTTYATGVTSTTWVDYGAINGATYYYKVSAVNAIGKSAQSNEAAATLNANIPYAPGLNAAGGNNQVMLSWYVQGGATLYDLYRSMTPGGEGLTPIVSGITGVGYLDNTAVNGIKYYYKLAAVNSSGTSSQSAEVNATPNASLPASPAPLTAMAISGHVNLNWTAASTATSYNIFRSTSPGAEGFSPQATGIKATTWTDTNVNHGTAYYYVVAGVNSNGTGSRSNEASIAP